MRFGRRRGQEPDQDSYDETDAPDDGPGGSAVDDPAAGPYDIEEIELEDGTFVDLGSLLVRPHEGTELRLQVDEASGSVMAVLLMSETGGVELRAFAAPRSGDLWADVRREIAADTARRGGTTDEGDGPFGPELSCQVPVTLDDGTSALQPSRIIGVNGPRWFLRATLLGQPAVEPAAAAEWEDAIRAVVVRRGTEAMPPGEALPLELPSDARRIDGG